MTASRYSAIALDLGTTSIKSGLLDQHGELSSIAAAPAPNMIVSGGRYESDALAYAEAAERLLAECMANAGGCGSLGLCSQRSSFLVWEQASGQPLTPLISWQDNRGAASCDALREHERLISSLSGLPLTPYYFAPKLRIVLLQNPAWRQRLECGELRAGTLDTFLIWRLTAGNRFVTDASMAARTMLMDIRQVQWSPELCGLFGIPPGILPEIIPSAGMNIRLDNGLVLRACFGDQSAALFASVSEDRAEALVNLGTGCFVVRHLPDGMEASKGYLQTLVYQGNDRHVHFAIEGTLNSIAAALAPYPVDEVGFEDLAKDNIYCLAEPSGIGAPYFRRDIGIRYSEPVEHLSGRRIAALLLEAVIFRVMHILEDMQREKAIERVWLSGGLSALPGLQQGIASCVPFDVFRLRYSESSLQGAALLAAGMASATSREGARVELAGDARALVEKYRGWKVWLDEMLGQPG